MRVEQFRGALSLALSLCVLGGCAENPPAPIFERVAARTPVRQVAPVVSDEKSAKPALPVAPKSTPREADMIVLAEPLAAPENAVPARGKPLALAATPSANPAIAALLAGATSDIADQRFDDANAKIDRALQIGADSPQVWHRFAKLKFAQGEYDQALTLAQRSNSLAPRDGQLRAMNWLLVADVERIRGNDAASAAALDQARQAAAPSASSD